MGISVETLVQVHEDHYQASLKASKDPGGGPYPVHTSRKSWDAASGPDERCAELHQVQRAEQGGRARLASHGAADEGHRRKKR